MQITYFVISPHSLNPESLTFQWRSTGVYWKDYTGSKSVTYSELRNCYAVLPIMMIPLSVFLPYKSNRIANITIGLMMTITIGLMMTIFLGLISQFGELVFRSSYLGHFV